LGIGFLKLKSWAEALNPQGFKKMEEPCGSKAGRVATGPERAFGFQWGGLRDAKDTTSTKCFSFERISLDILSF